MAPYYPRNERKFLKMSLPSDSVSSYKGFRTCHPPVNTSCFGKSHASSPLLVSIHACPCLCLLLLEIWISSFKAQSKSSSIRKMCEAHPPGRVRLSLFCNTKDTESRIQAQCKHFGDTIHFQVLLPL